MSVGAKLAVSIAPVPPDTLSPAIGEASVESHRPEPPIWSDGAGEGVVMARFLLLHGYEQTPLMKVRWLTGS